MQRDGVNAVKARSAFAILKRQADFGQITQCDDTVAIGFDRQVVDVLYPVKGRRDIDGKRALFVGNFARCNQQVVVRNHVDQLASCDVIRLKLKRIHDHFDHFIALAGQLRLKNSVQRLKVLLEFLAHADQCAFRNVTGQVHDDNREFTKVDFVDRIAVGPIRKLGLGGIHRVTHVRHDGGFVPAKFEL